jgi:hypothetical protein
MTEVRNCRHIGAVFANCFGQLVGIISKELVRWTTALDLPALTAWSKTPPRPLREALRMGLGRAGWKQLPFRTTSSLRPSEKVHGEARSGSGSLSVSVSKGRVMGFGHSEPGTPTVLLRC